MKTTNKLFWSILAVLIGTLGFTSCSSDDEGEISQAKILQGVNGIIPLKEKIGEWDTAYLTNLGYFCYNAEAFPKGKVPASNGAYSSVTFMNPDGSDIVSLLTTKEGNIPTQMITKKGIVYFSFPNDSILELLYDDGKR